MDQVQPNSMNNNQKYFNSKKIINSKLSRVIFGGIILLALIVWIFGNNKAGYYQVLQKWPGGELEIVQEPGVYWQGPFSTVTEFKISDTVSFVDKYEEGEEEKIKTGWGMKVIFKDNGDGVINGVVRYSLPPDKEKMKKIMKIARTEAILKKIIAANINTVLNLVASSYKSGESVRERGRLIRDVFDALQNGLIAYEKKIVENNIVMSSITSGSEIKRVPGLTSKFGIAFNNFILKSVDYDRQTQTKLDEHRLLEQQRNNAVLAAEKLKQEPITAQAEEEKLMAETSAQEEHKKLEAQIRAETEKQVAQINAEKEREVTKIMLEQAELEKRMRIEEAEGKKIASLKEAEGRKALAEADNSLALRLQLKKETLIGIADALKDINVPHTIIGSTEGKGAAGNPVLDLFLMNQIKELQTASR